MACIGSTQFERGDEAEGFLIATSVADKGWKIFKITDLTGKKLKESLPTVEFPHKILFGRLYRVMEKTPITIVFSNKI